MSLIRSVTVYLSSSSDVDAAYHAAANDLGRAIAAAGWSLVYGGNNIGLMGKLADAARAAGGKVIGITPRLMVDEGIADQACDELVVTDNMRIRKGLLEERGDAFIALPGGLGTFEELFEIIVGRILGYHKKPIVLLNIAGYYDPLLAMIEHGIAQKFIRPKARQAYFVANDVAAAIAYLKEISASHVTTGKPEGEPSAELE
jgi:uncharacterized protein (TIGR00730 family)